MIKDQLDDLNHLRGRHEEATKEYKQISEMMDRLGNEQETYTAGDGVNALDIAPDGCNKVIPKYIYPCECRERLIRQPWSHCNITKYIY